MDRNMTPKPGTAILTKWRRKLGRPRTANFTLRVKEQALRLTPSESLVMMMMMMIIMIMIVRLRMRT
jgi:hypothetical protein